MARKPKANPASLGPSKAPTQTLPASLVAIIRARGMTSRSASPQTSRSRASACSRSSKLRRSRMTTFPGDSAMAVKESIYASQDDSGISSSLYAGGFADPENFAQLAFQHFPCPCLGQRTLHKLYQAGHFIFGDARLQRQQQLFFVQL